MSTARFHALGGDFPLVEIVRYFRLCGVTHFSGARRCQHSELESEFHDFAGSTVSYACDYLAYTTVGTRIMMLAYAASITAKRGFYLRPFLRVQTGAILLRSGTVDHHADALAHAMRGFRLRFPDFDQYCTNFITPNFADVPLGQHGKSVRRQRLNPLRRVFRVFPTVAVVCVVVIGAALKVLRLRSASILILNC